MVKAGLPTEEAVKEVEEPIVREVMRGLKVICFGVDFLLILSEYWWVK
jgi:hypothetical protein